jgi:hypothetical protein
MRQSSLGVGLAALGRPSYITSGRRDALGAVSDRTVEALRARAWRVLDSAWDLGIRFIDVARSYGHAEEFLGGWLAARPDRRGQLRISSKWGYEYVADWDPAATEHERTERRPTVHWAARPTTTSSTQQPKTAERSRTVTSSGGSGISRIAGHASGSPRAGHPRPEPSSVRSTCLRHPSRQCRQRGICWNGRLRRNWQRPQPPDGLWSSKRHWRTGA